MAIFLKVILTTLFLTLGVSGLLASERSCGKGPLKFTAHDTVRQQLEGQGYEVRKIETDDGCLEVYAVREGKMFELYLNPETYSIEHMKEKS